MKFIDLKTEESAERFLSYIKNNEKINEGVRFEDKQGGRPYMHVKDNDGKIKIKCEMIGRPTKDNGFLTGTVFRGKITEDGGVTTLKGIITTSFIYHLIMGALAIFWIVCMIVFFTPVFIPLLVILAVSELLFFKDEFKKQGYIERYLLRALRRMEKESYNK